METLFGKPPELHINSPCLWLLARPFCYFLFSDSRSSIRRFALLDPQMRTISQAFYLINPSLDKMVMSEWVHRFLLKGEDAQAVLCVKKWKPIFISECTCTTQLVRTTAFFKSGGLESPKLAPEPF